MYEHYYGLRAKPFSLRPDPQFFFGSKGHARAMAYLEYGLSQDEGFIVVTGEVGAGKTTLVRMLLRQIEQQHFVVAHIVNTYLNCDDTLKMVLAGFGIACDDGASKPAMLARLEAFLHQCGAQGRRALLVIDEAQNLTPRVVEELRMLSNFQTDDKSLLQTFLLGQPEFRVTLHRPDMQQLRQRVIATYHLGPMDEAETCAYVEHRLRTVDWQADSLSFTAGAHAAIHAYSGGIPRKTNHLCDRLLLMGFLEEIRHFTGADVEMVVQDIGQEFVPAASASAGVVAAAAAARPAAGTDAGLDASPYADTDAGPAGMADGAAAQFGAVAGYAPQYPAPLDERILKLEKSLVSVLSVLKKIVRAPAASHYPIDNLE